MPIIFYIRKQDLILTRRKLHFFATKFQNAQYF